MFHPDDTFEPTEIDAPYPTAPAAVPLDAGALVARGYKKGRPPWISAESDRTDRGAAAGAWCDACGHFGLSLVQFHRLRSGRSYKAFCVCPACNHATEF